ncbi:hypothetical protein HHK36_017386 [Tetracentron sinense]|uniref:Uncharacterized protein n=1 Tax=Tetracentron sinense TaxID=13715 RepID=A0A835DCK8_TETSI|nr:hypothetical protein HHK36_017386 [Tetracentron sinense]
MIGEGWLSSIRHVLAAGFQGVGVVTQDKTTQLVDEDPVTNLLKRLGRGTATFSFDSARKVPTGPDPLHHNNFPLRP